MAARFHATGWFHTLRWIPPGQLAALVRERLRRVFEDPSLFAARAAPEEPELRSDAGPAPPLTPAHDPAALQSGRFRFLNRSLDLGWPPRWEDAKAPRLWLYNLHYFEFLPSLGYEAGREAILDWIRQHPLRKAAVGWEPYPVSLRLQAWCGWLYGTHRSRFLADTELRAAVWSSLWLQVEWLRRHLEHHLRGNHLLENAIALGRCGALYQGLGEAWLDEALDLLDAELPEQILADGLHFERSPMYHARALAALAPLADSGVPELADRIAARLPGMRSALGQLSHPDGGIALLNDAAFGIAPEPAALIEDAPSQGCFALPDAGYFGARSGGHYIVCDAAPVAPDYQPGHAHGDLLSFELSLDGQRVIVDAGVHGYDGDLLREWCRSTRAHNTVEIEGADQCEFWSTFRVARRGRPRDVRWEAGGEGFELSARHDGYERLPGAPRHERRFVWQHEGVLEVRDRVSAQRSVSGVSRLHLHPDCTIVESTEREATVRYPTGAVRIRFEGEGRLSIDPSTWCPEFGLRFESRALAWAFEGRDVESRFWIERLEVS